MMGQPGLAGTLRSGGYNPVLRVPTKSQRGRRCLPEPAWSRHPPNTEYPWVPPCSTPPGGLEMRYMGQLVSRDRIPLVPPNGDVASRNDRVERPVAAAPCRRVSVLAGFCDAVGLPSVLRQIARPTVHAR